MRTRYPSPLLTTAALSNHSHGNPALYLTNLSGTTASNSAGLSLSLSAGAAGTGGGIAAAAGTQTGNTGTIVFANSNGVTFGMSGSSQVTASHNGLTTAAASNHSHGNPTLNLTNLSGTTASNSAGFTLSLSAGNYLTTARASTDAVGLNTAQSNVTWTVNSAGLSFDARGYAGTATGATNASVTANSAGISVSVGPYITTAMASNRGTDFVQATAAFAGTNASGTIASNGLSVSVGAYITTARASTDAIGLNTAITQNGVSMTANSSGLSLNFPAFLTTAAQSNHSHGNPTLALTNLSGTTASASNGLTLSLSAAAPGGGVTVSSYSPPWAFSGMATNSSLGQSTLYFQPFDLDKYVYASRINFYISLSGALSAGNSTGTCSAGIGYAIYTLNSDSLSLLTSYSAQIHSQSMTSNTAYRATHYIGMSGFTSHSTSQVGLSTSNATTYQATSLNGQRMIALPVGSTLSPGRYWLGMSVQTVTGNAMTNNLSVMITSVGVQPDIRPFGVNSAATNASVFRMMQGWGTYSAQSAGWPNSIAYTTDNIRAPVNQTLVHFALAGVSTNTNYL